MKRNYRIVVNNYHAQIKRTDPYGWYYSAEEAADEIVRMFYDRIDDEASAYADTEADFDEANEKWHEAYSKFFSNLKRELVDGLSYEDGDGHSYRVVCDEEDGE